MADWRWHHLLAEAKMQRDLQGFQTLSDFIPRLTNPQQCVDIGKGWCIRYNTQCNGFEFFHPTECVNGLPCCPVQNCNGYIFGGVYCEHVSPPQAQNASELFPGGVYSDYEFMKLRDLMCRAWRTSWDGGNGQPSMIELLAKDKFESLEHGISVTLDGPASKTLLIHHTSTGSYFRKCADATCNNLGTHKNGGNFYCQHHIGPLAHWCREESSARKEIAFQTLHQRCNGEQSSDIGDLQQWTRTLGYIAVAGEAGLDINVGDGTIVVRLNDKGLQWRPWYTTSKWWHVCVQCRTPLRAPSDIAQMLCVPHAREPAVDIGTLLPHKINSISSSANKRR